MGTPVIDCVDPLFPRESIFILRGDIQTHGSGCGQEGSVSQEVPVLILSPIVAIHPLPVQTGLMGAWGGHLMKPGLSLIGLTTSKIDYLLDFIKSLPKQLAKPDGLFTDLI